MSTYKARVVTKQFKIETRQHELFGLDLGEGPRRRDLGPVSYTHLRAHET